MFEAKDKANLFATTFAKKYCLAVENENRYTQNTGDSLSTPAGWGCAGAATAKTNNNYRNNRKDKFETRGNEKARTYWN